MDKTEVPDDRDLSVPPVEEDVDRDRFEARPDVQDGTFEDRGGWY
jgi:hypothetical protein